VSTLVKMTSRAYEHVPVLLDAVVQAFHFSRPAFVIDGTLGLGGHSEALLERYPTMTVLGLEWDAKALGIARERLARFGDRFEAVEASYTHIPSVLSDRGRQAADGILLDLGLSSLQLQDSDRGFSFLRPGPLDMRMSQSLTQTAWHVLSHSSEEELARLFRTYGEEPQARKIATALVHAIHQKSLANDAWHIAELIRKTVSSPMHRIDPATRCFQALRIHVNNELANLQQVLGHLKTSLSPQGRAAFISFHSLEDRAVKVAFQAAVKGCVCPPQIPQCMCGQAPWGKQVTRKPIIATPEETEQNPRSRSAKLRVLEHL
jgi:16S rRNA (cytosine1402-N4)-methyltransferase